MAVLLASGDFRLKAEAARPHDSELKAEAAGEVPQPGRYITDTPQGIAILRIEEQRAPTPQDIAVLVESARSNDGLIQDAAIRALGRLERRDVVTELLPYLRTQRSEAR